MPTKDDFHVGQKVFIFKPYSKGEPAEGEVVKVGRTLVHVRNVKYSVDRVEAYRMEDGRYNGDFGGHIRTMAQQEEHERRQTAQGRLKELGYEFRSLGYKLIPADLIEATVETIEKHLPSR